MNGDAALRQWGGVTSEKGLGPYGFTALQAAAVDPRLTVAAATIPSAWLMRRSYGERQGGSEG